MSALFRAIAIWWHFQRREWTHYDLGADLKTDTRLARRDVAEAFADLFEPRP